MTTSTTKAGTWGALRVALLVLAAIGCAISLLLAIMDAQASVVGGGGLGDAFCPASARIDCSHVLRSEWASIGGVSSSLLGFVYFAGLGLWYGVVGLPNRAGRNWHWVPTAIAAAGIAMSLYFVDVMATKLPVWCTWCLAAHGVNAVLFGLTISAWRAIGRGEPAASEATATATGTAEPTAYPSLLRASGLVGGSVAVMAFLAVSLFAFKTRYELANCAALYIEATNNPAYVRSRLEQMRPVAITIRPDDPAFGAADAPHTLVAFTDFQCPHCMRLHKAAPRLVAMFPDHLRIVFKHFPICRECNEHAAADMHTYACEAARAAEAALAVGTPEQQMGFRTRIFSMGGRLSGRPYEAIAKDVGIDMAAYRAALGDGPGDQRIAEDIALAHKLGVTGAGVYYLDGRRMPTWHLTHPKKRDTIDTPATVRLWELLLETTAKKPATQPASASDAD